MIEKITEKEIKESQVQGNLADRPSQLTAYGGKAMTPDQVKAAYDKLPKLIAQKFNKLIDSIPGATGNYLREDSLAAMMLTGIRSGHTLKNLFEEIKSGAFLEDALEKVTDDLIDQIREDIEKVFLSSGVTQKLESHDALFEKLNGDLTKLSEADRQINNVINEILKQRLVESVNGKTGAVTLNAGDVGAEASGTAAGLLTGHNTSEAAHNDLRLLITGLANRLNAFLDSDDETLDQASEFVAYLKANRELIDSITTSKVSVSDIIDNLYTNVSNKPLSAAQGMVLKGLIDSITVPTKTSQLTNDSGFLTKNKVESVNGKTGAVTLNAGDVGAEASGTAAGLLTGHNTSEAAHNDLRLLITGLANRLNAFLDSDDETLDQASEFVAYLKANRELIDSITTSKVSVSDIIDNLYTNVSNKPLSAAQGAVLKGLIDSITVPTKTSQLANDSNFATTTKAETWTFTIKNTDGTTTTVTKKVVLA